MLTSIKLKSFQRAHFGSFQAYLLFSIEENKSKSDKAGLSSLSIAIYFDKQVKKSKMGGGGRRHENKHYFILGKMLIQHFENAMHI